ncbi:THAP domain-containing 9 [Paramuricea clavata]|uniref:THAP domain-containing 9, partial n=1 Tax=Paramuricea clavata TaxID=317549 RepID=A0A6S7K770_PARCT|nr:THAP domain-containing 9 [Paramuricea clavata]
MGDIIQELQQKLLICQDDAELLSAKFDGVQLAIFRDTKNNVSCDPCGRRYVDVVKEFATTLNYYSPKAYEYVRSIIPLPHPSLIRKWSSVVECNPGFFKESFESLKKEALLSPEKKDCCLIIDGMAIRKQTLWDSKNDKYVGFVDYGHIPTSKPDQYASEALVFVLVGARSNWKCPIGYFLTDKMTGKMQAKLVQEALIMAAEAGLRVYSVTADGTSVNFTMFSELGCKFTTSYESMITKFKHPTQNYFVYAILDPCYMLKLARNALGHLGSIVDCENNIITWKLFSSLNKIQECEGFQLANKFSSRHLQFLKHKMNVQLAAQTLSSSVADAIEFLDKSLKLKEFQNSIGTVKFIRIVDRLFDILNSRNPIAKGFKQPLRPQSRNTWEEILKHIFC